MTTGITAKLPFPMSWPEQDVKVVEEQTSPHVRSVRFRVLEKGVKQAMITIPRLAAGEEAVALWTLEIVKRDIVAPHATGASASPAKSSAEASHRTFPPAPTSKATTRKFANRSGRSSPASRRLGKGRSDVRLGTRQGRVPV